MSQAFSQLGATEKANNKGDPSTHKSADVSAPSLDSFKEVTAVMLV